MGRDIAVAAAAAAAGVLVAFIGYLFSKAILLKMPERFALSTVVRQLLNVGLLVGAYFIGEAFDKVNLTYILVGAVLGLTLPMLIFTKKLLKLNTSAAKERKGENDNG